MESPVLVSESSPNDGTISLMTEVSGLSAARLDVRSPGPERCPRELNDHDWLREWLREFWWWRVPGEYSPPGTTTPASMTLVSKSIPTSCPLPFMTLTLPDFIAVTQELDGRKRDNTHLQLCTRPVTVGDESRLVYIMYMFNICRFNVSHMAQKASVLIRARTMYIHVMYMYIQSDSHL